MASKKQHNVFTLVCGDDWQGLYKNDELIIEDHRIRVEDALNGVIQAGGISEFIRRDCSYEWLSDIGHLPKELCNVKFIAD